MGHRIDLMSFCLQIINIPKTFRRLFPGYKIPFVFGTNGEIEIYAVGGYPTEEQAHRDAGTYFTKGLNK